MQSQKLKRDLTPQNRELLEQRTHAMTIVGTRTVNSHKQESCHPGFLLAQQGPNRSRTMVLQPSKGP